MSAKQINVRLLTLNPKLWIAQGRLHARTAFLVRLLALFSYDRQVILNPRTRLITVERRALWLLQTRRTIPFARVECITYRFRRLITSWSWWVGTTDQLEIFTIRLVLRDPKETVTLLRFSGEGSLRTGWCGVLLGGDSIVELSGTQEEDSRAYVSILARVIGAPLGRRPIEPVRDERGNTYACVQCTRNNPPTLSRCQYCGAEIVPVTG